MDSKKRVRVMIHILLVIAIMTFIFSHSLANRAQSSEESMGVLNFLMKILGTVGLGGGLTEHVVRKMAHFSEFAALGFFAAIVMQDIRIVRIPYVLNVFLFGILCAMTD
ncbi:VanZ family protein, partial [Butyricicoccus sp.]|uniref:VanZ family protein n=1 Tax=Butyricicoccus sp. TaxID=2049021 RepID=UPI003D7EE3DB